MLSTYCCSCLSVFIPGLWITTKLQFPKWTFTSSCFHLEAFYYFSPLKFHTPANPEVWVERGALIYSFAISGSITGFSNLGQILYKIQSKSNSLPFTYTCHKSCSPSQYTYQMEIHWKSDAARDWMTCSGNTRSLTWSQKEQSKFLNPDPVFWAWTGWT